MGKTIEKGYRFLMIILIHIAVLNVDTYAQTIYVSSDGDDQNAGTMEAPVLTLHQARRLCKNAEDESSTILLKGGDMFTHHIGTRSDFDGNRISAFIWDINKGLTISTYGSSEKAVLYGGFYKHNDEPVIAILIIEPSEKPVLIENISFEMWEESTLVIYETENVTARNIEVHKAGTYYFTDERAAAFLPGVIYPKNSKNILIDGVVMTNGHNVPGDRGGLHGFYCTRLGDSEIRNVFMTNVSGSALKVRREPHGRGSNNLYFHNFETYYTGLSVTTGDMKNESWQLGFLRLSGEFYHDNTANCPSNIKIENSIFHYPFCWNNEGEDCTKAKATLCSNSNESACGENACQEDTTRVNWVNNDIILEWDSTKYWQPRTTVAPPDPVSLVVDSISDHVVRLKWEHTGDIADRFIIHRKTETTEFSAYRVVHEASRMFVDRGVKDSTLYSYRIKACRDNMCSEYSNTATDSTSGVVRVIAPNQLKAEAIEGGIININWRDNSDNEDGFVVERGASEDSFEELVQLESNISSYSDTDLQDSLIYYYRVKAIRNQIGSKYTNMASDTAFFKVSVPEEPPVLAIEPQLSSEDFVLIQNCYPNPFTESATIDYKLTEASRVEIRIFNMTGQVVETLANGKQQSGEHQVNWKPKAIPSGTYIVNISTNNVTEKVRLVYAKQ